MYKRNDTSPQKRSAKRLFIGILRRTSTSTSDAVLGAKRKREESMKFLRTIMLTLVAMLPRLVSAEPTTIDHVTILEVADGSRVPNQSISFDGDRITAIGPSPLRGAGRRIDGTGLFVLPGLWDMHVHSHRERRWTYHYPLFRAFGITGVRDGCTHLGSALAHRAQVKADPLAPRVIWGSPIVDGAPQVNSFGLSAEDETSARHLVRELHRQGFDFLKVYDRLSPGAYRGLTSEARRLGMPIEGHVPLALSPDLVITSGQRLIDHLTLIAEGCSPRTLSVIHAKNAKNSRESDSLSILMSNEVATAMANFDIRTCQPLFNRLARHGVWQVPTFVQLETFVSPKAPSDWSALRDYVSPGLQAD